MKKLLLAPIFFLAAFFIAAPQAEAQEVSNYTACTYSIDVFVASVGSCTAVTSFNIILTPGSTINLNLPPFVQVLGYRGVDVSGIVPCDAFKVGQACFGLPSIYSFVCNCAATAETDPSSGDMKIYP